MGRGLRDQKFSEFNLEDDTSSIGIETSFSDDTHWTCESMDLVDSQKVKNLCHSDSRKSQVVEEGRESSNLQIDCSRHHL